MDLCSRKSQASDFFVLEPILPDFSLFYFFSKTKIRCISAPVQEVSLTEITFRNICAARTNPSCIKVPEDHSKLENPLTDLYRKRYGEEKVIHECGAVVQHSVTAYYCSVYV